MTKFHSLPAFWDIARNERHLCPQAQHLMSADSNSDMRIRDQATCDQAF